MNPQNSIIALAPDGIGRAIVSETTLRDLMKSNVKKRKSRWDEDKNQENYTGATKRGRYRRSRWGPEEEKTFTPQPFSYLPQNVTQNELETLIRRHRLDDIQRILALNDFETNDPDLRSLSPEPIYDPKTGVRTNTRELRTKEKYMREKNAIIEELLKLDPTFVAPADYKPMKKIKKLYIPDPDNPASNVIGLIIGQKGQNQKALEQKSGCKIAIRGKGAAQSTKIYNRAERDENEPLHVLIQGDSDENIQKAVDLIEPLINPYADPEKRKSHMLQLAVRSVLHDEFCDNCGERGHKWWDCPNKLGQDLNKPKVMCEICHDRSHPTYDCPLRKSGVNTSSEITLHEEFSRFMRELKGPDWEDTAQPRALKAAEERPAIEYPGAPADTSVEALSRNVAMNQFTRTANQPVRPLAIEQAPPEKMETSFKGTTSDIKLENVIMLDANGNPVGSMAPEGAVTNPVMNPVYAAMYAPYLSSYNYMMQNPSAYYSTMPQGYMNSSLAGFPQMKRPEDQPPQ